MAFHFDDFVLDPKQYELRRQGVRVSMEPQVFDVLALLIANRDRVVTKEELMDKVWGDRYISEAALNSRIMSARKAIGDSGREQRLISTVHGRGYRFIGEVAESDAAGHDAPAPATAGIAAVSVGDRPAREGRAVFIAVQPPFLLGREAEMARLRAWFDAARAGQRQVVLIGGEAGLGKTTLVQAFLSGLDPDAVSVAHGQCLEHHGDGEPYMPILEALTRLCLSEPGGETLQEIRSLAPSWLAQMPGLVDSREVVAFQPNHIGASRERMLREIVECLDSLGRVRPLLLVLEDLHWSDFSTVEVLSNLARRPDSTSLMVIATYRPADASASRHTLTPTLRELTLRGYAHELSLSTLAPAAVEAYVQERSGGRVAGEVADALVQRTGGNPLYMGMVYDAWLADGLLEDSAKASPSQVVLSQALPESVRAYIDQRFGLLSETERAVLECASVVGREFSAAAVAPALSMPLEEVEAVCETLVRSGYFITRSGEVEWPDGTVSEGYAFLHDLYEEVLYRGIPAARAGRLHRDAGLALEAGYGSRASEKAVELAMHFTRGRMADRAVRYLRLAGEQALQRAADQEAVEHLARALQFVDRLPAGPERDRNELMILLELASALIPGRGWSDSQVESYYLRALKLAESLADEYLISVALFGMATMYEVRGEYARSAELMDRRLVMDSPDIESTPIESFELLACSEFHRGLFEDALKHAEQGVHLYKPSQPPIRTWQATPGEDSGIGCYHWAGLSLLFLGHPDQALQRLHEGLELAREPDNVYSLSLANGQAAVTFQLLNLPEPALEHARIAKDSGYQSGFLYHVAWSGVIEGWAAVMLGDCDAIEGLRESMQRSLDTGAQMDHHYYQGLLADAHRVCGNYDAGLAMVEESLTSLATGRSFFYEPELLRLKGLLLLERDGEAARDVARAAFDAALAAAREQGSKLFELRAAIALARLARPRTPEHKTARELLSGLAAAYQEGLDTPDLKDARALLRV